MEQAPTVLNAGTLQLQKLALELKCPLCLQLFNRPMLLPCNHMFCDLCTPKSTQSEAECPACKHQYVDGDVKSLAFMENIVNIYRNLDAIFNAENFQPVCSDAGRVSSLHAASFKTNANDNSRKVCFETLQEGNSSNAQAMDGNCSYPSNSHENLEKKSVRRPVGDGTHTTNVKKQKKTSNGFGDACNLETELEKPLSSGQSSMVKDPLNSKGKLCAFCHSCKHTEDTGPLLSFANGKEVVGNEANSSKAIHIHDKCMRWTPQIFFEGGLIKNLESEVARANKLKCSSCGKKGAGLGCYMATCPRTYHVPCAYRILDCRWSSDYLLFCPQHASCTFPSERKNPKKKCSEKRISKELNPCTTSSNAEKKLVLCGSALSPEEKYYIVEFARTRGAIVSKFWRSDVTHVIAAADSNGACTRTMKVLMAILDGKWVLTMEWVKACVEAGHLVNEEPYEVKLDKHGCSGGPKAGRQRALAQAPKIFDGLSFYFSGEFSEMMRNDLYKLVRSGGGNVIQRKDGLLASSKDANARTLVVYNSEVTDDDCVFEDADSIKSQRVAEAEDIAQETASNVVAHTWVLDSIAACELLPFTYGV